MLSALKKYCQTQPLIAILLGFWLYALFMTGFIPAWISLLCFLTQQDVVQLTTWMSGVDSIPLHAIRIISIFEGGGQMLTWGLAAIIMANLSETRLNAFENRTLFWAFIGVVLMIGALPLAQWIMFDSDTFHFTGVLQDFAQWSKEKELMTQKVLKSLLSDKSISALVLNTFVFAMIPALCEELFFRGFLQQNLAKIMHPILAIILTGIIFSFMHFQFFGFFSRMLLGWVLGYIFYASGALFPSMLAHFCFNFLTVLATWLGINDLGEESGKPFSHTEMPVVLASLFILILVVFFSNKWRIKRA